MELNKGHRKRRSTAPAQRACTECQRRKTRCMRINDNASYCSYCVKTGKRCTFETPIERTSLTRINLDAAELRCNRLESLLGSLKPELDIEAALRDFAQSPLPPNAPKSPSSPVRRGSAGSEDYEWHEASLSGAPNSSKDEDAERDGMATLPTNKQGAGYLGSSSGSSLLQAISEFYSTEGSWICEDPGNGSQNGHAQRSRAQSTAHLLLQEQLSVSAAVEHLIDAYFLYYNSSYPILHERTFRDRYQTGSLNRCKASFQMTFYMVLALGHWLSSSEHERMRAPYYAGARSLFTVQMLEAGTLGTVQALLLMGNYLQKMDRPNTGYNLIGIAYRMALGLGLHREVPSRIQTDNLARERRRQVFWTLYCFDSGFSITTGRPTTISDAFIDARFPRNIDDSQCTLASVVLPEVQYPTSYSAIIEQSKLAIIANQIHASLMSAQTSRTEVDPNIASKIEQMLFDWRNSIASYVTSETIPSWFRGPRAVLFWKEQNLRILLWQAVERNPALRPGRLESRRKCAAVAFEAVQEIAKFCSEYPDITHPGLSWYATYFLFQATLVLLLHKLQEKGRRASQLSGGTEQFDTPGMGGIAESRECLNFLGQNSNAAKRCLAVLDRISEPLSSPSPSKSYPEDQSGLMPTVQSENSYGTILQSETSPEAATIFGEYWSTTVDPSLSMFLGDAAMRDLFQDFNGFPGTLEHDFDYINHNLYNIGFDGLNNNMEFF